MIELMVPEIISCHSLKRDNWEYGDLYRHCNYCGSMHPQDLIETLKIGGTLRPTDWKYGWPHKHYVYDRSQAYAGKWYNVHLVDIDDAASFTAIAAMLRIHAGIEWYMNVDSLAYRAPQPERQRYVI